MAKLVYAAITSLDGFVSDPDGNFDWGMPSDEEHAFINNLERPIGTYLYGRRMYEVMLYWETADTDPDQSAVERDFTEIWQAADKIVFSRSLDAVSTAKTRIERQFDPDAIRKLKEGASSDISVAGADLAGQAIRTGLVDELHLFVNPIAVGGGTAALPAGVRVAFELIDEHRFDGGVVHLRYRLSRS